MRDDRGDVVAAAPELLERDPELAALGAYWQEARSGHGRLVFLGGEAGSGKTSLASALGARVAARARVLVGACDGASTPRPLGPLVDVAEPLGLRSALEAGEVHRTSLFPEVRRALGRVPTLLLLEDVHWSDEATLDLIRFLGRRLEGLPLLVLATFRDDEVSGTHPLAVVRGELGSSSSVRRLQLPLLSARAVAVLADRSGRDLDPAALYASTDGNPFFVTEILASGAATMPATVRDAVVARASRLTAGPRHVLDTAAVVGREADIGLVLEVSGESSDALDACVRAGVLIGAGTRVRFRHELAHRAVADVLPPARRVALHSAVLSRLAASGSRDHRALTEHAIAAGDAIAVLRHAPVAAGQAARLGAHREASEHWRAVLRHGDGLDAPQRAEVLERLSYECSLTSQADEALQTRREALELRQATGEVARIGVDQRWLSRVLWFLGRNAEAEHWAMAAVGTLEPLGPTPDLAMAYANVAHLRMLNGDAEEALAWGRRARSAARSVGDREVEAHALNSIGVALMRLGVEAEGQARLHESLAMALADELDEQAARAYTNIAAMQVIKRRLAEAEQTLRTGIAYCDGRDLDQFSLYLRGWLAAVLIEHGHAGRALDLTHEVLARPQLSLVNRITALQAVALVSLRRGDPHLGDQLAEVRTLASAAPEPLRLLPLALLQAEAAWTEGRTGDIVPLTDQVWSAFATSSEPWILAELAWWRRIGGAEDVAAFALPEPFVLMRDGRPREAGAAWTALGRPFWAALALAAGDQQDTADSVALLLRLDAPATAHAVRRDLAARGLPVPRGPRRTALSNAAGLTARELDVLGHLVEGLTDAEIAAALTLSQRTVGHHVSAVLRKLGVPSRSRAAAAAATVLPRGPT